jgi:cytochrome c553
MNYRTLFFLLLVLPGVQLHAESAVNNYLKHCSSCHGPQRLGAMGPALLPDNLGRLKKPQAIDIISNGRAATQMQGFSALLGKDEVSALADYIYTKPETTPTWGAEDIAQAHKLFVTSKELPTEPVHKADLMNMFVVVELGDHHATILDGDTFEPMHRFRTHFALHGGPKYSPDGRFVYFASRDGWISKFDMWSLQMVAETRAGINTRNVAISSDGKSIIVGNYLPNSLVLLDADDLGLLKIIDVRDSDGKTSRVSAVYDAAPRKSFIAALKDVPEIWEIPYAQESTPAASKGERFPVRRILLDDYLDDFFFDQSYTHLMGAARNAKNGQVIDLDLGRKIAELELDGLPHLSSGITFNYEGRTVLATPHIGRGEVSVIDMQSWKTIKRIETEGPGFFMRSHENTPYAWVDVFFGPNKDKVHIIDKRTLEIVKTLAPAPGKTAAHVEFDKDGKHALLSIWDMDGALVIYDANTLKEVKRLPMVKPSGKYNVHNKITRSAGTSH